MKVVVNDIIPFKGYAAINLFGICFMRTDYAATASSERIARTIRHESIHSAQQKELLYVGFYILYLLEWLFRLVFHTRTAYKGISFEKEAYAHQDEDDYLVKRKPFAQWRKA